MASIPTVAPRRGQNTSQWIANGALLATAIIWGANVPIMKIGLLEIEPFAFNALRLPLSALLLGILSLLEKPEPDEKPITGRTLLSVMAVGVLGSLIYQVLFVSGLARTSAASTGFIIASAPLWTAAIARMFGVERIGRYAWAGLGLAVAGAMIITAGGKFSDAGGSVLGNLILVAAMATWASSTVLSKSIVHGISPTKLAFLMTATMVPFHIMIGWPQMDPVWQGQVSTKAWACIAFSGLLSTGWTYALWYYGVRHVGPSRTAVYASLVPVITLGGAIWILGETVTGWQITGGVLVLAGLAIMQRFAAAHARAKETQA